MSITVFPQRRARGFSLLEAVISVAVLSVATVTFLSTMHSASMVSNEEAIETDIQTRTRKMMDSLVKDLTNARVLYLPNNSSGPVVGAPVVSVMDPSNNLVPVVTSDPDVAEHPVWLLMKYQVPLVVKDPNNSIGIGSFSSSSYDNYSYSGLDSASKPVSWGAYAPATGALTAGATYDLVFKQIRVIDECPFNGSGPVTAPPDPVLGSPFGINADLDGDGAKTNRYIVGEIQRRYSPSNNAAASIGQTIDYVYPGEIVFLYDGSAGSSSLRWEAKYVSIGMAPTPPQYSLFYWVEWPGDAGYTLSQDGIYHYYLNDGSRQYATLTYPGVMKTQKLSAGDFRYPGASPGDGWMDTNGNGVWDPLLAINIRFIEGSGNLLRMKVLQTRTMIRNQPLGYESQL